MLLMLIIHLMLLLRQIIDASFIAIIFILVVLIVLEVQLLLKTAYREIVVIAIKLFSI